MCTWHCSRSKWKQTIVRRRLGQPTDRPTACQGLLSVIPSRGARPSCDRRHTCRRLSCAPRTTGSFCVPIRTRKLRTISIKTQSNQAQANAAKVAQNSRGCGRGSGLQIDYVLGAQMRLRADAVNFRDYCCATTTHRELCAVHASGRRDSRRRTNTRGRFNDLLGWGGRHMAAAASRKHCTIAAVWHKHAHFHSQLDTRNRAGPERTGPSGAGERVRIAHSACVLCAIGARENARKNVY